MKKRLLSFVLLPLLAGGLVCFGQAQKPKLVVIVVVDQFRADYLSRFRADYTGGFDRMLRHGANYASAHYEHFPTVTAVGHSIISTGAMPAVSGIVGNSWVDRASGNKQVTSVCDFDYKVVGGATPAGDPAKCTDRDPASPRRLLVSTIGDELRNRDENARVIGVSLKPRSAILPAGHRANGAFWFDDTSGSFISSSYYFNDLPQWVKDFNAQNLAAAYVQRKWDGFPKWDFQTKGDHPYNKIPASPWGNELIEAMAEHAITGEQLGQRGSTDLLTVSFSSNDYIGHAVGPDAPEVRDMAIRTDRLLGKLFALIDAKVGLSKTLVVLSADHGVSPSPVTQKAHKMPGGNTSADAVAQVRLALDQKFGKAEWLLPGSSQTAMYWNYQTLKEKNVGVDAAGRIATETIMSAPQIHVSRVYTREQLLMGGRGDFITTAALNGFYPARSADLFIIYEPYFFPGSGNGVGSSHFTPYVYDNHVPVVFFGMGVKAGTYHRNIAVNDIAPTLAAAMGVELPSGAFGNVLYEVVP
jgi:predicted AlkP superfamily pyrophosphatase or phosphodiesterase